nr:3-phosphoshikimate 1-carboxyvinyltransferase [uncultured Holophaga sp.]
MIQIQPGPVKGSLRAPASKSHAQRVLLLSALAQGTTRIQDPGDSGDVRACLNVVRALGARVEVEGTEVRVTGGGRPTGEVLDCGESGTCLRSAAAVAALFEGPLSLAGHGSLATRPMGMIVEALQQLGVQVETQGGCPPVTIRGPLKGGQAQIDGSLSSQLLTGLLLALPLAVGNSVLTVKNLKSGPYVRMTLDVLRSFGLRVEAADDLSRFVIPGGQTCTGVDVEVEGDWSGAAFPLVAGAIAGEVTLSGLLPDSSQADRVILDALAAAGAHSEWISPRTVRVLQTPLKAFDFDATDCPDLFPPLAVLACHCAGTSVFRGAERLRHKESDRATALVEELGALGGQVRVEGDLMRITGGPLHGGMVDSRNDHRIAMAGAIAALHASAPVGIQGPGCVAKSYPAFFEHLAVLQGRH